VPHSGDPHAALNLRLVLARVAAGVDRLDLDRGDDALDLGAARTAEHQAIRRAADQDAAVFDEGDALDDVVGRELVGHARERLLLVPTIHVRVAVGLDRLPGQALGDDAPKVAARIFPWPLARIEANSDAVALPQRRANHSGVPCSTSVWILMPPPSPRDQ
jgi:hypothetical protein